MPQEVTPDGLADRICRRLELSTTDNAKVVAGLFRGALREVKDAAVANTKAARLVTAEEETEHSHAVGATAAQQTVLIITGRIGNRAIGQRGAFRCHPAHRDAN